MSLLTSIFLLLAALSANGASQSAGTILFMRDTSSGAEDTLGLYCDNGNDDCQGRRKHNGEITLQKPIARKKAVALLTQYSKPGKLPRHTAPSAAEGRKLRWHLNYGNFSTSGEIAVDGAELMDDRVRILEAELSALTGRAP